MVRTRADEVREVIAEAGARRLHLVDATRFDAARAGTPCMAPTLRGRWITACA